MRRRYEDLNDTERAIVKSALAHESFTRDDILEQLDSDYDEDEVRDAFTTLCDSQRLVREGNTANYMMVARDLF
jgi:hypothetical protein